MEDLMDKPIRVLCVMSTLDRGGAETMVMNLFRKIDRESVVFDFVKHSQGKDAYDDEIISLGGKIYKAPRYKIYNHVGYKKWWKTFLTEHPEYQIIHGHYFNFSAIFFKIAKKYNRITVGHSHCTQIPKQAGDSLLKAKLLNYYVSKVEKYSDYCLACSKEAGLWLFPDKEFVVLNNAIDVNKFRYDKESAAQVRREFGLEDSFIIGAVGRFDLQKNPEGILEVFRRIQLERPESKLLWVGEGQIKEQMISRTKELGLEESVLFLGVRTDVNRLLQCFDAFIFPSFYEGLGIAAIEAQAAGVYCYCSDVIPSEVNITPFCHFLSLDDYQKWADEIVKTKCGYVHEDTYEQIKAAGYDINDTAKWLKDFYLSIYNKKIEAENGNKPCDN